MGKEKKSAVGGAGAKAQNKPSQNDGQLKGALNNLLKMTAVSENISVWDRYNGVAEIINILSQLQDPAPPKKFAKQNRKTNLHSKRKENIAYFLDWIKENGVNIDGLEIAEFPEYGLGIKARKNFEAGSTILNIPRKLILTEESAKVSKYGQFLSEEIKDHFFPHTTIALHLLLIKYTADPFWKPYIDILPMKYNTILYFNQEEMKLLEGSPAFIPSMQTCIHIGIQYAYLHNLFEKSDNPMSNIMKKNFTYNDFRWAVSTIMTRLNSIPLEADPEVKVNALIPMWDMFNHCSGIITTNFDVDNNQLECFALKDYKEGEQMFIFYGVKSNRYFFQYNGFVFPENENDSFPVTLGISPHDPLQDNRIKLLEKLGLNKKSECTIVNKENPISQSLLAFARILVMTEGELTEWLNGDKFDDLMTEEHQNNTELESLNKKAYKYINTRCMLLKAAYKNIEIPIVNENDDAKPGKNEQHCYLIRLLKQCEMNLLQKAVDFTKDKI